MGDGRMVTAAGQVLRCLCLESGLTDMGRGKVGGSGVGTQGPGEM